MVKITIVMGYYNRINQLTITLDTIQKSSEIKNIEVIIVDDASTEEHIIPQSLIDKYTFTIKVYRIPPAIKNWRNPVIAYNLGLEMATGEWIIIQNPEVCHIGDICHYISNNCNPEEYYAFNVISIPNQENNNALKGYITAEKIYETIRPKLGKEIKNGIWYCHQAHRPKAYHFCTAIHRSKLDLVGGFNNEMKDGVDYDDDELLERISRICKVKFVLESQSKCLGIHLWHPKFNHQGDQNVISKCRSHNLAIYRKTVKNKAFIKENRSEILPPLKDLTYISNESSKL